MHSVVIGLLALFAASVNSAFAAGGKLVIADAAIALLSLLHIVRRRTGLPTKEFFDQDMRPDTRQHTGALEDRTRRDGGG